MGTYTILRVFTLHLFLYSPINEKKERNLLVKENKELKFSSSQRFVKRSLKYLIFISKKHRSIFPDCLFQIINKKINNKKQINKKKEKYFEKINKSEEVFNEVRKKIENIEDLIIRNEVKNIRYLSVQKLVIGCLANLKPIPMKYRLFFPVSLFPNLSFLVELPLKHEIKKNKLIFSIIKIKNEIKKAPSIWQKHILFYLNEGVLLTSFFKYILTAELFPYLNLFINTSSEMKMFSVDFQNNPYSLSKRQYILYFYNFSLLLNKRFFLYSLKIYEMEGAIYDKSLLEIPSFKDVLIEIEKIQPLFIKSQVKLILSEKKLLNPFFNYLLPKDTFPILNLFIIKNFAYQHFNLFFLKELDEINTSKAYLSDDYLYCEERDLWVISSVEKYKNKNEKTNLYCENKNNELHSNSSNDISCDQESCCFNDYYTNKINPLKS